MSTAWWITTILGITAAMAGSISATPGVDLSPLLHALLESYASAVVALLGVTHMGLPGTKPNSSVEGPSIPTVPVVPPVVLTELAHEVLSPGGLPTTDPAAKVWTGPVPPPTV